MPAAATIGLLHGMSGVATVDYYRRLNRGVNELRGGHAAADLLLASVDFADVEAFVHEERWAQAGRYLAERARRLEAAGAAFVLLGSNTMHRVAPTIEAALTVPFVHIVDPVADAARARGLARLGLLGTRATMEDPRYAARFGLELLVPPLAQRQRIDDITFDELVHDRFPEWARRAFVDAVEALVARGAQAIVLGCTEFGLLVRPADVPGTVLLDSTALHVERAVRLSLGLDPLASVGASPRDGPEATPAP